MAAVFNLVSESLDISTNKQTMEAVDSNANKPFLSNNIWQLYLVKSSRAHLGILKLIKVFFVTMAAMHL